MLGIMPVSIAFRTREISAHSCFTSARMQVHIGAFPRNAIFHPTIWFEVEALWRIILIASFDRYATNVLHVFFRAYEFSLLVSVTRLTTQYSISNGFFLDPLSWTRPVRIAMRPLFTTVIVGSIQAIDICARFVRCIHFQNPTFVTYLINASMRHVAALV
jgi:hypothetical protein